MKKEGIIILGASSDLGCELINQIIDNFDYIVAHYRNMNEKLEALIEKNPNKILAIKADLAIDNDVDNLIEKLIKLEYKPTYLVNIAANVLQHTRFEKSYNEQCKLEMQISVYSFAKILSYLIPYMKKNEKGKIVVILSSCTKGVPPKFLSSYVTVKYALLGLVKALSSDYAEKGISVNAVSPEMMETKFLNNIPEYVKEQNANNSPIGRNLKVQDVVPTIKLLLSDDSNCISGQNVFITGGK